VHTQAERQQANRQTDSKEIAEPPVVPTNCNTSSQHL